MKTYEFIYIATGFHYLSFFDGFVRSLENFCPDTVNKKVKLLTDDILFDISPYKDLKNISVELYYIENMPWPLVTLFKLHYIKHFLNDEFDMIWYLNANFRFNPVNDISGLQVSDESGFHFFQVRKIGVFRGWYTENPYNSQLPYILGTAFCGSKDEMKKCCDFCMKHINENLFNNTIEPKHDETALNYYMSKLAENKDKYFIEYLNDFGKLDQERHVYTVNGKEKVVLHLNGQTNHNNTENSMTDFLKPIKIIKKKMS